MDNGFWKRLASAMQEAGFKPTTIAAAKLAGVRQPSVQKWKTGGLPKQARAAKIATALGVTTEWLMTGNGSRYQEPDDALWNELATIWNILSDPLRGRLLDMAKGMQASVDVASQPGGRFRQRSRPGAPYEPADT